MILLLVLLYLSHWYICWLYSKVPIIYFIVVCSMILKLISNFRRNIMHNLPLCFAYISLTCIYTHKQIRKWQRMYNEAVGSKFCRKKLFKRAPHIPLADVTSLALFVYYWLFVYKFNPPLSVIIHNTDNLNVVFVFKKYIWNNLLSKTTVI